MKIPKKGGGFRNLSVLDEVLKIIQKRITEVLLIHMPVSRYAKAYRFGSSTLRNAKHHVGKHVVLKLDILHFFDSIRYSTVKDTVFTKEIYSEPIRILLTMLCYRKDALPQGAPSSPAISNTIMYEFDEQILYSKYGARVAETCEACDQGSLLRELPSPIITILTTS